MQHLLPLKGISILLIIVFHLCGQVFQGNPYWFRMLTYQGVHIFFLLSGVGLSYSLLTKRNKDVEGVNWFYWYRRRATKILPLYWLVLLLTAAAVFFDYGFLHVGIDNSADAPYFPFHFLSHFFLIHIYFKETFYSLNPAWWFLAVIAHFYIFFPGIFTLLKSPRNRFLLTISIIFLYLLNRQLQIFNQQISLSFCYFFFGCLLPFYDMQEIHSVLLRHVKAWLICSFSALIYFLLAIAGYFPRFFKIFTNDLLSVAASIFLYTLVLALSHQSEERSEPGLLHFLFFFGQKTLMKSLNILGDISYAMFLIHWGFILPFFDHFKRMSFSLLFYFSAMLIISYALTRANILLYRRTFK